MPNVIESIKPSKEQIAITTKRDLTPGTKVMAEISNHKNALKGKVMALAMFPDIYQWYIIRLQGYDGYSAYYTIRHDKLTICKPKVLK